MTHAKRARRAALITLLACAGFSAPASAETYCVAVPSCPGTDVGATSAAVQQALDLADATMEPDHVMLGPGTFDGFADGYDYNSASPLELSGAGPATKLTMTPPSLGERILELIGPGPDSVIVRDLEFLLPDGTGGRGPELDGASLLRVTVRSSPATSQAIGIVMIEDAVVRQSDVQVAGEFARGITVGSLSTDSFYRVEDTRVRSDGTGISAGPTPGTEPAEIRRVDVRAAGPALELARHRANVSGSLLVSTGPEVVAVGTTPQGPSVLRADHVTIAGAGGPAQRGVRVTSEGPGEVATAALEDSIVAAVGVPFSRTAPLGGESVISAERVAHAPGGEATGPGATAGTSAFPEPALTADFRLAGGSPLIDASDPASADESATDAAGGPRALDGNGDCAAVPDVGAFEFAPATVQVRASAPQQATAGQAVAFSAAGTCDADPSALLTYTWAFDDGTTATGPMVEHAFATGGAHTGTLTVAGGGGRTGTATAMVTVIGDAAGDRTAPRLSKLRRVKGAKRPTVRFTLDEPATVAVRIQRCKARKGACKPAKRTVKARWAAKAGTTKRALPKRIKRPGRYRVRLVATDAAGNRAEAKAIVVRVRSARPATTERRLGSVRRALRRSAGRA